MMPGMYMLIWIVRQGFDLFVKIRMQGMGTYHKIEKSQKRKKEISLFAANRFEHRLLEDHIIVVNLTPINGK